LQKIANPLKKYEDSVVEIWYYQYYQSTFPRISSLILYTNLLIIPKYRGQLDSVAMYVENSSKRQQRRRKKEFDMTQIIHRYKN